MTYFRRFKKVLSSEKSYFCATLTRWVINHPCPISNGQYKKKKEAFSTPIGTFILDINKRAAASKQPP